MFELEIAACNQELVDKINVLLEDLGALSITMSDSHDHPILEPEIGTSPLWPEVSVKALFDDMLTAQLAQQLIHNESHTVASEIKQVEEQNWELVCKNDAKPMQFGNNFWICPSWSTLPDPNATHLILDPGLAFGTGTHPTTALCLEWLATHEIHEQTLIDFGCGSGILALAALKLGVKTVYAVDIDPQALQATKENARTNDLLNFSLTVDMPENLQHPVDILMANILLTPLITLKDRFKKLLKSKGILVVSGILSSQVQELCDAYDGIFVLKSQQQMNEWSLVEFQAID